MKRLTVILILLICLPLTAWGDEKNSEEDPTVFTQGEVIVTGKRSPAELTSSIQEITADDIHAMGATNVAEALQGAVGLRVDMAPTVLSANGKQEELASLRGFDPRDVIILVDGIPVYEPYFRVLDLRQIPVGDVAKITITKGPSSILYGPNSLGGIINIITRKGSGPPRGHVDASYGDVESFAGNASVLGSAGGFEYFMAPGFSRSDGFRISDDFHRTRNEDGKLRENSDYEDYYLSGKAGYSQGFNSVTLSANHYAFTGGVPFSMEATEPGTLWRKDWRKTSAALFGSFSPAPWFLFRGNAYYTRLYDTITTYTDTSMSSVAGEGDAVSTFDNNIFGYHLLPEFHLGPAGSVTLSILYKQDKAATQDEIGVKWNQFGVETYSVGAEYGLNWKWLSVTAGAAEHFFRKTRTPDKTLGKDTSVEDYQAGLAFSPDSSFRLHAGVARKSSFPDLRSLYGSNGNPDLKSELALNTDLGLWWQPVPLLNISVTGFYSNVTDLIGKRELGNTFEYENIDKATIEGTETCLNINLWNKRISLDLAHTYMNTRDESPDRKLKRLDFRPEHTGSADLRFTFPFGTFLGVQYYYVGERSYEEPNKDQTIKSLPEYGLVNARLSQRFAWDQNRTSAEFSILVRNLFDVYYEESPEKASPGRMLGTQIGIDFQ